MTQIIQSLGPEMELTGGLPGVQDELAHVSRLVTVGELAACFAHEVFNPLMMIQGHLRFLEEMMTETDPLRSHFEVIDRASRRIEDMARRMLDFSRKRTPQLEFANVRDLVDDAARFVHPYMQANTINVEVDVDPELHDVLIVRWSMVQAFVNLMQNAADAMANGPRRTLTISARADKTCVRVSFTDSGKGIAAKDLSQIFAPFFTTKGEQGTGLGLYITRRIVEEIRGTIAVQSSDTGTTFTVSLPQQ
jgi:signal transduction histidine kinase